MQKIELTKLLKTARECGLQEASAAAAELFPTVSAADPAVQALLLELEERLAAKKRELRAAEVSLAIAKAK